MYKDINKNKILLVIIFCFLFFLLLSEFYQSNITEAFMITKDSDLFTNSNNIEIKANMEAPDTFKSITEGTVNRDFDLGKNGILLSSSINGANVDLTPTFTGSFETTFRAYSETSYYDETGSDWNSSTIEMSPYADLKEVSFIFTDKKGQFFTVIITAGENWNTVTPVAHVSFNGIEIGYHYLNDATEPNDTSLKNSSGYFTRIGGTTFCNVTRRESELTSENSMPVTFGFNKDTMEIYVLHYGINSTKDGEYRVVVDLDSPSMGLRRINNFDDYQVSIEMTSIADDKTANMIIYDINGQDLSGEKITNNIGPDVYYTPKVNGLVNEKYILEKPTTFDLVEGDIDFNGYVTVKNQVGTIQKIYESDGTEINDSIYHLGAYFIPASSEKYTISYTALDKDLIQGKTKSVAIDVFGSFPEATFSILGNYHGLKENAEIGLNSVLPIYPAKVNSLMYISDHLIFAEVTILKNNEIYQQIDKVCANNLFNITFSDLGNYQIIYSVPGFNDLGNTYNISFTVTNTVPTYELSNELNYIQPNHSTLIIPSLNATLNGDTKKATPILYDPDGIRVTLNDNSVVLDKIGEYKIRYMVKFDKIYTVSYCFTVANSSDDLFTTENYNVQIETGATSGNLYPSAYQGVKITATAENVSATYKNVIDLTDNTKNDSLIEIMVLPLEIGKLDAWQFTMRLTDIYDKKNYVDIIVFKGSWGDQWSYIRAGSSDQTSAGWEMGKVLTAYNTGTPVGFSFTGNSNMGAETLNLYYDNEEKAVYASNIKRPGYSYDNQVIDLDSTDCFYENSLWEGFTTGEVYMSVSFQYMQSSQASVLIKSINGVELGNTWISDIEKPTIFVNTNDYEANDLPQGLVNTAYPIFKARAYDKVDGVVDYTVKVYKDYQTANQIEYEIIDNNFYPDSIGNYTIVYIAKDGSKNLAEKNLLVNVVSKLDELSYDFSDIIPSSIYVGEIITIPNGIAMGGTGQKTVQISVFNPDNQELNYENNQFIIQDEGIYKIVVTITDFLGNRNIITQKIYATYSESPIITDFYINPLFINNVSYVLPDFEAIDYYTDKDFPQEAIKCITVTYNGQTTTLGKDRLFIPNVINNGDEVEIRYIAKAVGSDKTSIRTFKTNILKVIQDDGTINLSKYFMTKDITNIEATSKYIEYKTNSSNASLVFANPLIANGLNFEISVPKESNNVDKIVATIHDSLNPQIAFDIIIYKNISPTASTSTMSINDGEKFVVAGSFYDITTYGFSLSYNQTSQYIMDTNANTLIEKVTKTKYGTEFNGFPSGKAFISFSFGEVTGESAIRIMSLNNQIFSNDTVDRIKPELQLDSPINKVGEINKPFKAPKAYALDVLDPQVTLTLEIKKGTSTVYKGKIDEDYIFNPTSYGLYRFIYTVTDSSGRKQQTTYLVIIKDKIPPTLELNKQVPETGKCNKMINLPNATISDNYDENLRLWIIITAPDGEVRTLSEGELSFTPTLQGKYRVTYYIQDSYNNYIYESYAIEIR